MTTLYISTSVPTTKEDVARLVALQGVECQVYENCTTSRDHSGSVVSEKGYKLKLFGIEKEDFKEKVWNSLENSFGVTCAHVKYRDEYRGCIRNWPKVFVDTQCGWEQCNKESEENEIKKEDVASGF